MTTLNINQLRKDTHACEQVLHFNNAGAALMPSHVVQAMKQHLDLEASIGGYEAADKASTLLDDFYDAAALLIQASRDEIAFTENATRAWEMAFYSLPFQSGDRILTSSAEYASNYLAFLQRAKQTGLIIDVVKDDEFGQLDTQDLAQKMNKHVKLIAITHIPTQGGLINPAEKVGEIAKNWRVPYLLDATQSVGQMPVDVNKIGCDFLCATGRKYLRGPRGTGFLYARKACIAQMEPPFIDLHAARWIDDSHYLLRDDALRFETWEQNYAGKLGLRAAIRYALNLDPRVTWKRIQYLAHDLRQQLLQIPGIVIQDQGEHQCGIVTFSSNVKSPEDIQRYLGTQKINVSVSLLEYARLDLAKRNLPSVVRASVHYYNTEAEIELFCDVLSRWVKTQI